MSAAILQQSQKLHWASSSYSVWIVAPSSFQPAGLSNKMAGPRAHLYCAGFYTVYYFILITMIIDVLFVVLVWIKLIKFFNYSIIVICWSWILSIYCLSLKSDDYYYCIAFAILNKWEMFFNYSILLFVNHGYWFSIYCSSFSINKYYYFINICYLKYMRKVFQLINYCYLLIMNIFYLLFIILDWPLLLLYYICNFK